MTTSVAVSFRSSEIVAALAVGCVALLMLGLQPALLGALIEQRRISLEGVGIVAMGEIFSLGIGVVLAEKWFPLNRLRLVAVSASLLLVGVNLLTLLARGDVACAVLRVAAGLLEACLFWITTMVIIRSRQPDRLAGIFLTAQTLAQALIALMLAQISVPALGWREGFVVLAVVSLLPLLLVTRIPAQVGSHTEAIQPSVVSLRGFFGLLVPFAHMSAVGAIWAYLEPLEKNVGIAGGRADQLVALVLVMQMVGGSIASVTVRHWKVPVVLTVSSVAFAAVGVLMHQLSGAVAFTMLCVAFGFLWLFQMPFHIRLAFDIDPQGRIAMLVPAAQLLGSGFGPLMASLAVHGDDAHRVPLIATGFIVCAALALFAATSRMLSGYGRYGVTSG